MTFDARDFFQHTYLLIDLTFHYFAFKHFTILVENARKFAFSSVLIKVAEPIPFGRNSDSPALKFQQCLWYIYCGFFREKNIIILYLWWSPRLMVLNLDGNSELGAHARSNPCYLICLRHLIRLRAVTNRIIVLRKDLFCSELPSII